MTPERRREIAAKAGAASKSDIEQKRSAGKLGGIARKAALSPERAREIALKAVQAREAKRQAKRQNATEDLTLPNGKS